MTLGRFMRISFFMLAAVQAAFVAVSAPAAAQTLAERRDCYNRCIIQYERRMKPDEGITHHFSNHCKKVCEYKGG